MRRSLIGLMVLLLICVGESTVFAEGGQCSKPCGTSAQASAVTSCSPSNASAASCENPQGRIAGHFDPAMSGVCRFACATRLKYKSKDVMAQPGAKTGKLTQCPVSGVVFAVDANRPHVHIAGNDYVTCCDKCATKPRKDPHLYRKA